ncbi:MAG: tRNA lysidine(34) synthetase TilS [Planctomycetota bacterium]|jgi:tRNA(Ile)-lysidine synthase
MLSKFEDKVAGFIKAESCFGPAEKILLAVSGGADSTALLYSIYALKEEGIVSAELLCCHINHQLRGAEADQDENFVVTQASKLGLSVITRRVDVRESAVKNKLSIETAARKLRIENLVDTAKTNDCDIIATGHQKNDNAETIIQRLSRGTGLRGLGGIWPLRSFGEGVNFARPLLSVSRDEIVTYLKERNIQWQLDRSNENYTYRRNYIRHRLIPALQQQCKGSIVEQLSDLSQSARRFYSLVCEHAEKVWQAATECAGGSLRLDMQKFSSLPQFVKVELIRRSLTAIGSGEKDLTQQHYEKILQLSQQNKSCRRIELPGGFVVWREYGSLIFAQSKEEKQLEHRTEKSVELKVPGDIDKFSREKSELIEWFDFDKVKQPLVVRSRKVGDRFRPLGLLGEKRIGKFLTAARIEHKLRKKVVIIADKNKIIWVGPIRASELTKIKASTKRILQIRLRQL